MIRKIVKIDREKCSGCGLCARACHEGAIAMVEGKAQLIREDYCDGLGDCLPVCPAGAISFEIREAEAYNEAAVQEAKRDKNQGNADRIAVAAAKKLTAARHSDSGSELRNFPVQMKLAAANAGCFKNADLLIAADCTAYACGNFHKKYMKGRITLIGCTKLDSTDYSEKLRDIFTENRIKSVTVLRMQVPCCGGMTLAVKTAIKNSGKPIPCTVITLNNHGEAINTEIL